MLSRQNRQASVLGRRTDRQDREERQAETTANVGERSPGTTGPSPTVRGLLTAAAHVTGMGGSLIGGDLGERRLCTSSEEAVPMDITTVNDRHLYHGRVGVQDPANPSLQMRD